MRKHQKSFQVCAAYDTETTTTTTTGEGANARAFPCLFIVNDLRGVDLNVYESPRDDAIKFYRYESEMLAYIEELASWGVSRGIVPVIAAYNLTFDLQPLRAELVKRYDCAVMAQSTAKFYTFDLLRDGEIVLRFWDTFFLEMGGLAAMGEVAGLPKALGDWDYSKIRTPETPLTQREEHYAARDVQVIPAYLRYVLHANEFLQPDDLGVRVLTKTSIVRKMAEREIGTQQVQTHNGKPMNLFQAFCGLCSLELPHDFATYALRKACFRGGLTFTAARTASQVVLNVCSLDVTSMHHAFINGRRVPVRFRPCMPESLTRVGRYIMSRTIAQVLADYQQPFQYAVHACARFTNLRLKHGSAFEFYGIATLAEGKFLKQVQADRFGGDGDYSEAKAAAENAARSKYRDYAEGATFAFGKLVRATVACVFVSEIELWNIAQVYEFDDFEILFGELSTRTIAPPDYVTAQSNLLFRQKNDAKRINNTYHEGEPYTEEIPESIPEGIAEGLRSGELSNRFFASWYQSTVKGSFNGIYGTQAQDVFKPIYYVGDDAAVHVQESEVPAAENFESLVPERCKVLYTYGLRIVAGSRMHLIIAMLLIYSKFGRRALITGGDTDSLKVSLDGLAPIDLVDALEPLHRAIRAAIDFNMRRLRRDMPQFASGLEHVGEFDIEACDMAGNLTYEKHFEAWNKCRVSLDRTGCVHVTAAGLSRPEKQFHIETFLENLMSAGHPFEEIAPLVFSYNCEIAPEVSHLLGRTRPPFDSVYNERVTDYTGASAQVRAHESQALYDAPRVIGDTGVFTNACNVAYLAQVYGREVSTAYKRVGVRSGIPYIEVFAGDIIEGKKI